MWTWVQDMATADNKPKDVDVEYMVSFTIINEGGSFMLRQNLAKYLPSLPQLQYATLAGTIATFQDQENFHSINGKTIPVCDNVSFLPSVFYCLI